MERNTTFTDIQTRFHSMPQTRHKIPEGLEMEWLETAIADYELEVGVDLGYNDVTADFPKKLDGNIVRTLALMMYASYLQRELSRVMALNGIYGKDVQLTGMDATKRVTKQELDSELARVNVLLHKQKQNAFA